MDDRASAHRSRSSAFSMVEMLLVVTMLGIVTLMSVPNLVRSIRGNRLRSAARSVVASGKYARSMAVMRQQDQRLVFHIDAARIEVADAARRTLRNTEPILADQADETEHTGPGQRSLSRALKHARIEFVDIEDQGMVTEGSCFVAYHSNGRCTPYSVGLIDRRGTRRMISVDALSTARAEEEL